METKMMKEDIGISITKHLIIVTVPAISVGATSNCCYAVANAGFTSSSSSCYRCSSTDAIADAIADDDSAVTIDLGSKKFPFSYVAETTTGGITENQLGIEESVDADAKRRTGHDEHVTERVEFADADVIGDGGGGGGGIVQNPSGVNGVVDEKWRVANERQQTSADRHELTPASAPWFRRGRRGRGKRRRGRAGGGEGGGGGDAKSFVDTVAVAAADAVAVGDRR